MEVLLGFEPRRREFDSHFPRQKNIMFNYIYERPTPRSDVKRIGTKGVLVLWVNTLSCHDRATGSSPVYPAIRRKCCW